MAYRSGVAGVHINPTYLGIKDVFQKVYAEGGVRSLYRGVGMSLLPCFHHPDVFISAEFVQLFHLSLVSLSEKVNFSAV